jgi:hypothetical protein
VIEVARLDVLRLYDSGVINWLRDPKVGIHVKQRPVPVIFATPERAFSEMADLLGKSQIPDWPELDKAMIKLTPEQLRDDPSLVPTPFVSVKRGSPAFRMDRSSTIAWRKVFTTQVGTVYFDSKQNYVIRSKHPRPYDLPYQLDIWCRYREDLNSIMSQLMRWGNPWFAIWADLKVPWGKQLFDVKMGTFTDNSELEGLEGGTGQSWKRATLDVTLEGYLLEAFESMSDLAGLYMDPSAFTSLTPVAKELDIEVGIKNQDGTVQVIDRTVEKPLTSGG